ncbi:MAG: HlyD family efflux transporter periplasmic adaptor subunit [Candidatus Riflebacteria bacterium]|nr:HlyD family efflux transporter periplasmic adaptor subunit [Candidatus Riflebacteria bacterium]
MKRLVGILITIVCFAVFAGAAWKSFHAIKTRQDNAPKSTATQSAMQFLAVAAGTGARTLPALATLKSHATVKVMPETAGRLVFLNKREGDQVTAGEVIARIEGDELQAQLNVAGAQSSSVEKQTRAAEETIRSLSSQRPALVANERFWRSEQERDRTLFEQGALSKAQWEATANKFAEAQGKLAALDAQIEASRAQKQAVASQKDAAAQTVALWKVRNRYAEVVAPVTGIISARVQEVGNYVTPASVLYQMEDTRSCRLVMQVPQQYVDDLRVGQRVTTDGTGNLVAAGFVLSRIYPTGNDLYQRTVEAESTAPLANPDFERQYAVNIVIAEASGTIIPADSFFQPPNATATPDTVAVYLVSGETARRLPLSPLLLTDRGEAVVDPGVLPAGSRLLRLGYLEYARLPERLTVKDGERR